jgi:hypothetical protein
MEHQDTLALGAVYVRKKEKREEYFFFIQLQINQLFMALSARRSLGEQIH